MRNFTRILLLPVLFVLLIVPKSYAGQTGKIAGYVFDAETGEPLIGANVIVSAVWLDGKETPISEPMGAATGIDGDYFILNIRPGLYSVEAYYVGYNKKVITNVKVDVDKTTRLEFKLSSEVLTSEEITVTAYYPDDVEIDVTATKQVYSITDIEAIAGVADVDDILSMQADVVDDHFRGGRLGESSYLLGGGSIVNPLTNRRAFRPIVSGLEQVEVYTSGFSAEYGNAQSGVVNMVTREGSERWTTKFETSVTLPYYKTWQGSPYDEENQPFYQLLSDLEEWLEPNPVYPGYEHWEGSYTFGGHYLPNIITWPPVERTHEDTLKIARISQIAWLQAVRDMGMEYDKTMDYRIDFSTGGPISDNAKVFIAARQTKSYLEIPTVNADLDRQIMLNLAYKPNNSDKIKISHIYNLERYTKLSYFLRSMFDPELSAKFYENITNNFGLEWNHIFDKATILESKFNFMNIDNNTRINLLEDGEFHYDYSGNSNWAYYTGANDLRVGYPEDDDGKEIIQSFNYQSSLSKQWNRWNLIKTGFQFTHYNLDVDLDMSRSAEGNYTKVAFKENPREGALYIQDKMEFDGLIANVGLRLDYYDLNTRYYENKFHPLQSEKMPKTDPYLRLQPRIGISFPISSKSVFHLNYGTFTQRPTFNQLYYNQITIDSDIKQLGNPRLKPENTSSYDVGIVRSLPWGFKLDVSAYYKDVSDLVEAAYYQSTLETYQTFVNRDYADIKGFHISLEKKTGSITGYVRYNWESATGKSSNSLDAPVTYYEEPDEVWGDVQTPDAQDIYLDYDRTHKLLINLRYRTGRKDGPQILGGYPLGNISVSTTYRFSSGRPYTFNDDASGLLFNKRTPNETDLKLRLQKTMRFTDYYVTAYVEGFNLLNEMQYQYSRVFNDERETGRWHYDRENILLYNEWDPYNTSQAIYLLRNEPRHYRVGLIFKF